MYGYSKVRIFIFLILYFLYFLNSSTIYAEQIKGHFDTLPLMRDEAVKDNDNRAVEDIDYVLVTKDGEYFEVDNGDKSFEVVIIKYNRARQFKDLREKQDEDLLIFYYKEIRQLAVAYNKIIKEMMGRALSPEQAKQRFSNLISKYPTTSAIYRGIGVTELASGFFVTAVGTSEKAVALNSMDAKAYWLLSLSEYARHNKRASLKNYIKALKLYPMISSDFWEKEFIINKNPKLYSNWETEITKTVGIK